MPGRNILVTLPLAGLPPAFNFHELSIKQIRVPKGSDSWFQALLRLWLHYSIGFLFLARLLSLFLKKLQVVGFL